MRTVNVTIGWLYLCMTLCVCEITCIYFTLYLGHINIAISVKRTAIYKRALIRHGSGPNITTEPSGEAC